MLSQISLPILNLFVNCIQAVTHHYEVIWNKIFHLNSNGRNICISSWVSKCFLHSFKHNSFQSYKWVYTKFCIFLPVTWWNLNFCICVCLQGINFVNFKDFFQFLNNLDDFEIVLKMFTFADQPMNEGKSWLSQKNTSKDGSHQIACNNPLKLLISLMFFLEPSKSNVASHSWQSP